MVSSPVILKLSVACCSAWVFVSQLRRPELGPSTPSPGLTESPTMIIFFQALFPPPVEGLLCFGWRLSEGAFLVGINARRAR